MKRAKRATKRERKEQRAASLAANAPTGQPTDAAARMMNRIGVIATAVKDALTPRTKDAAIAAAKIAADAIDADIRDAKQRTHERVACAAGCNYCCHGMRVDVSIPEVARIAGHIEHNLDASARAAIRERARTNAEQTHGKSILQYPLRLRCALLGDEGACLVYAVRPVTCRNEHSTNVEQCRAGYEQQELGVDLPIDRIEALQVAGSMAVVGIASGVAESVGDGAPYELQEALHIALSTSGAVEQWLAGEDAFASSRVHDDEAVPMPPLVQLRSK